MQHAEGMVVQQGLRVPPALVAKVTNAHLFASDFLMAFTSPKA